ncbi:hypothetical protein H2199_008541 [Coniosporium tulheliwenetii]|uniref:Uncharacterized protein n=1 Tax=Coniosporium tulheliwenetii TaxID=3383036 RepID=A0ACC2YK82_9PEZI|nr:hypothetical protein H2199_008541 [Cladosporium sp. JES 115]
MFIYGGGFQTGGENVPYQIPAQWVQRSQNLIVVSFNYRLNVFGFPNAAGLSEQNLGLLDQRLAVEWVRDNIAGFGGDPTRIILWGQSAGAMSVDFYNFAHYDDPIVEGLIMNSGSALVPLRSADTSHSNFSFVASQVGCGNQADAAAELACMRGVPAQTLEQFVGTYQGSGATPGITFAPIADGKVVFDNYTERALEGKLAKVPAIIGTNSEDGVPFAPYNPSGPNQTIAQQALLTGRTTYRYEYRGNFTNISPRPWMGAYHSAELPLLFGTHPNYRGNSTPFEYAVSAAMQDAWQAFARDPNGGLATQDWPAYTGPGGAVRIFGADGTVAQTRDLSVLEAMCNGVPAIAS